MFLVPTGILTALIAREDTGRGQHVRTSLLQGALLYTTQIWTWATKAPGDFYGTMARRTRPAVHQEMIFEVADDEWVHTSIMSGLTPVEDAGRRSSASTPTRRIPSGTRCSRPRSAAQLTPKRRAAYKQRERDELDRRVPREQPRDRGDRVDGVTRSARSATPHPQLVANDMVATVDDPELGAHHPGRRADPPRSARPGAIQGPRPTPGSAQRRDLRRARLLGRRDRDVHGGERDARARRRARSSTSASTSRARSAR